MGTNLPNAYIFQTVVIRTLPGNADMRHVPRTEGHGLSIGDAGGGFGGADACTVGATVPSVTLTAGRDGLLAEECATDRKVTRPRLGKSCLRRLPSSRSTLHLLELSKYSVKDFFLIPQLRSG